MASGQLVVVENGSNQTPGQGRYCKHVASYTLKPIKTQMQMVVVSDDQDGDEKLATGIQSFCHLVRPRLCALAIQPARRISQVEWSSRVATSRRDASGSLALASDQMRSTRQDCLLVCLSVSEYNEQHRQRHQKQRDQTRSTSLHPPTR